MASNDVKIVIKATDEATPTFNNIKTGLGSVGDAMKKVQTETNSLSGYIKEQRKEGREHKFIINEMKDGLAAAGLMMNLMGSATGGATGQMKTLTDSVNKGIVVFYGMDAVISVLGKTFKALGGWVGLTITAVVAIGSAVASYIDESSRLEQSNKNTEDSFKNLTTEVDNLFGKLKGTSEANKIFVKSNIDIVQAEINVIKKRNLEIEKVTGSYVKGWGPVKKIIDVVTLQHKDLRTEFESNLLKLEPLINRLNTLQTTYLGLGATVNAFKETSAIQIKQYDQFYLKLNTLNLDYNTKLKFNQNDLAAHEKNLNAERINQQEIYGQQSFAIFQGLAVSMGAAIGESTQPIKGMLKAIANSFLDLAQAQLLASQAFAAGKAIFTSGFSLTNDLKQVFVGLAAISAARSFVASMHTGGTAFVDAPANREVPIMVRGQETIRVNTPEQERRFSSGGVVINFNSPVSDTQFITNSIKKVLQQTGLSLDKVFVNNRNTLSFSQ